MTNEVSQTDLAPALKEAISKIEQQKAEIEALTQERHQLRNELTAARLEGERLRAIENAALRVASSRREGIVTDMAVLDKLDAALEGRAHEPAAPPHCPTCLCGIGHCPKHPAAIFHPPAACPECASGNAAYSIEDMMAAEKSNPAPVQPVQYGPGAGVMLSQFFASSNEGTISQGYGCTLCGRSDSPCKHWTVETR